MRRPATICVCVALGSATAALTGAPDAARANPLKSACGLAGLISRTAEKACTVIRSPGKVLGAGKKILTGHPAQGVKTLLGSGSPGSKATAALTLAAVGAWVLGGAKFALTETARLLGATSSPQLGAAWFSSAYWRVAGIAALLTLPFLFAAAIQALMRSDLALLTRATFGYLPLSMLAVGIAAPVTMLLLAASDEMSTIVSAASGHATASFMAKAGATMGVAGVVARSPFVGFMIGLLTVAGALVLWLELLVRAAAVYVVVLMLPLAFAGMVWPARRVWAIRAVEVLVALILAKFAIVAVLGLGGAALNHLTTGGVAAGLAGAVLVILGAFAPWALLRLLPLAELGNGAAATLRPQLSEAVSGGSRIADGPARAWSEKGGDWATGVIASMRRDADGIDGAGVPHERAADADRARRDDLERVASAIADGARPGRSAESPDSAHAAPVGAGTTPSANGNGNASPAPEPSTPAERLPGMGPIWQAENWSWEPLVLGLEEDADWAPSDPPESKPQTPGRDRREPGGSGEQHDPLPESQDPNDGRL